MGKGYKDVPCVYCQTGMATTADHVIARAFFPEGKRDGLPKVAACSNCNSVKSRLEHSLAAIMPFGAQHADANSALAKVERMLIKNAKLHRQLAEGMSSAWRSINGGPWTPEMTIPVSHRDIERLCEFIVRGLASHHWNVALGPDHSVHASFFNEAGRRLFDQFFAGPGAKVRRDLGEGVFAYEGVQSTDCPELTLWKMSIYKAEVGGDKRQPGERSSMVYGISIPKKWPVSEQLMQLLTR